VSVGQYVEQAMLQLSERYFAEEFSDESSVVQERGNAPSSPEV
jgi:hypothetical protein